MLNSVNNPYTLQFSYVPPQYISRNSLMDGIVSDLIKDVPTFRCHFLTGVPGSGKTVMMTEISNNVKKNNKWICVDIENPEDNILDSLARGLYRIPSLRALFLEAKIDVSILGVGIAVERANIVETNTNDVLAAMLEVLKKTNKKLLVTIDEVTYCKEIAAFSHTLSSYARAGYEIYVLMTGLKDNIKAIKNDKSLTFLYRAKEHELEPLNITAIVADYEKVFGFDREMAEEMAWDTKGYSFAFQVLGYLYWEELSRKEMCDIDKDSIYKDYDQYLAEFVYDKIWSEIPRMEKSVLKSMAKVDDGSIKQIREIEKMDSSKFSVYRERLIDRGLVNGKEYGKVKFTLPRFDKYVEMQRI